MKPARSGSRWRPSWTPTGQKNKRWAGTTIWKTAFPFRAQYISERRSSPLKRGERVEVIGMAPEDDCTHEMFVEIRWKKRALAVPLAQLEALEGDERTQEGIGDWHYWMDGTRGYELG